MATKKTIVQAFTEMAPEYEQKVDGELHKFWGWSYAGFVDNLIQITPLRPGDRILDVATGTSVIPRELQYRGKSEGSIVGLDITLAMLNSGKQIMQSNGGMKDIHLACGSALSMPFRNDHFDVVLCGLASHHMDVTILLAEMNRVLKRGGHLTIADVGGSPAWRHPVIKNMIRMGTFLYFLPSEGPARARSESSALSNVRTVDEWGKALAQQGFGSIEITRLSTNHFWAPAPLVMRAKKP